MNTKIAKFQYDYSIRSNIENCNENKFNIYSMIVNNKEIKYMEYGENFYKVNFIKDLNNIIIDQWVSNNEKNKIIESSIKESYECDKIIKIYKWLNFSSFNYVKKNKIIIQNIDGGTYYNPTITFDDHIAIVKSKNKIISKVRDMRNITLLRSINKEKDLVYVSGNYIYINSLRLIDKDDVPLNVIIYEEDEKKYKRLLDRKSVV